MHQNTTCVTPKHHMYIRYTQLHKTYMSGIPEYNIVSVQIVRINYKHYNINKHKITFFKAYYSILFSCMYVCMHLKFILIFF